MAENSPSVTARKGVTVAPSPLNEVKLDLAIILVVGGLLLLVQGRLLDSVLMQLLALVSYGILGMLWIILRTRAVLRRIARTHVPHSDGPY